MGLVRGVNIYKRMEGLVIGPEVHNISHADG